MIRKATRSSYGSQKSPSELPCAIVLPNRVLSVVLSDDEDVEWAWRSTLDSVSYLSGYSVVDARCVAVLEKLGFVVVCETNGDAEEWVAMRDDLHLRAESPVKLLDLYSTREHHENANPRT